MKKHQWLWISVICLFSMLFLFADTNTPAQSQTTTPATEIPIGPDQLWLAGISLLTPVIVYGLGKIPNIPRPLLPTLAPFVGVGLGALISWLSTLHLSWFSTASAGAAAVAVREVINQWVTKQMKGEEGSKTDSTPVETGNQPN